MPTYTEEPKEIEDSLMGKKVVENFHDYNRIVTAIPEDNDESKKQPITVDHFQFYKEL